MRGVKIATRIGCLGYSILDVTAKGKTISITEDSGWFKFSSGKEAVLE